MDELFNNSSKLLAVKVFNPSSVMRDSGRLSDILLQWVKDVLNEFGMQVTDLMSATTDAGSDIKRMSSSLIGCHWDWCMSHLLNCALVEAFGTSLHPTSRGNKAAREVIIRAKKVVEYVNKSHPAKIALEEVQLASAVWALKVISDVPQRWKSTVMLLGQLLELWYG